MVKSTNIQAYPSGGGIHPGMTLRDYFAGQVIVGLLASNVDLPVEANAEAFAREAFVVADAMLAERKL